MPLSSCIVKTTIVTSIAKLVQSNNQTIITPEGNLAIQDDQTHFLQNINTLHLPNYA